MPAARSASRSPCGTAIKQQPRVSAEALGTWERPVRPFTASRVPRYADGMSGSFLGPRFERATTSPASSRRTATRRAATSRRLADRIAALMAQEKVVGLFQGRMEFGPRALGGRSIIGDARSPKMQSVMNLKIKFRESFRPFAPAVLREHVHEWFELDGESPYMLLVADVQPSQRLPVAAGNRESLGHREAERPALDRAGDHPRRLLGAHPDGAARGQPALLRHHQGVLRSEPAAR